MNSYLTVYFDMRLNITLPLLTENPLAFTDIAHFVCDGLAKHNLNVGIESPSISTWTDQSSRFIWQKQSPVHLPLYYIGKQICSSPAKGDFI